MLVLSQCLFCCTGLLTDDFQSTLLPQAVVPKEIARAMLQLLCLCLKSVLQACATVELACKPQPPGGLTAYDSSLKARLLLSWRVWTLAWGWQSRMSMHGCWNTEAFLVCGVASVCCHLFWIIGSGLLPLEAPVMIAEKRKFFFSFSFWIIEAFLSCFLIHKCALHMYDRRGFLGMCPGVCMIDTYSQEQAYIYAV